MNSDIIVAIISGIVTILVGIVSAIAAYKGAIKGAQLQIDKAKNDAEVAKQEEERLIKRFIESFLYDEIYNNLEIIHSSTVTAFKEKGDNTLKGGFHTGGYDFKFDTYHEIRPQLNKINNLEFVADIMSIYKCFRSINKIGKIDEMKSEEASEIYKGLNKWIEKLSVKHLQ
ncbi:hypothetical protein Q0N51_12435 [Priestia megaterium]|uniref:hypothetical protein n=1 Tax=Priestia megaterium TaxID=1404 RepID=UPI0034592E82